MAVTLPSPESLGLVMPQADRPTASYTGGIAQTAQESIGTAVSGVGDAVTKVADEIQTRHDQVATDDAVVQFQNSTFKRLYGDPSNPQDQGYYGTRGQDALNGRAPLLEGLESDRQAILSGLGSNAQRQGFNLASRRLYAIEQERAGAHANQQANVYGQNVQEAAQNISLKQIGADPTNDDLFTASLTQGSLASRNKAMLAGGSPEVADAAEADYRSKAYATRAVAIAGNDPSAALTFLKANQKEFNPQSYLTLQGELQTKSRGVDSGTIANGVMNGTLGTGSSGSADSITGAILGQEHSGPSSVSIDGARGTAQVMPATFKQYAKPGENFDNETDRLVVGKRVIADLSQRFNGDPARIAVGYFSGPGNVAPADSPTPWVQDKKDGNGTTTSAYVSGVLSRLGSGGQSASPTPQQNFAANRPYILPGIADDHSYSTRLSPSDEVKFQQWVTANKVPFDPKSTTPDYDMRGYWKASQDPAAWKTLQDGGKIPADVGPAGTRIDPNDGQPHYPDFWKTPYHQTFSNESQWAGPNAPHWTDDDKLVTPDGKVVFDDRARPSPPRSDAPTGQTGATTISPSGAPQLPDRNTAYQRAMDLTAHDPVLQQLTIMKMDRQFAMEDKVKKDAQEKASDTLTSQIIKDPTQITPEQIANDPNLGAERKEALFKFYQASLKENDHDVKTYGPGFSSAYQAVHAAPGDPNRITDPSQLYSRAGGDLTVAGVDKLRTELAESKTPEGASEGQAKKGVMDALHVMISQHAPGLGGGKDPVGEEKWGQAQIALLGAYDAGKKAGKTTTQLLSENSPDYIGKVAAPFIRSNAEKMADYFAANNPDAGAVGPAQGAAQPVVKVDLTTVPGIVAGYKAGHFGVGPAAYDAAVAEMQRRGFAKAPTPVPTGPQVPQ